MEQLTAKKLTPMKAIRAKCLDCSGESAKEVRLCPIKKCPLYPYRFGKRPVFDENTDQGENAKKSVASYGVMRNAGV